MVKKVSEFSSVVSFKVYSNCKYSYIHRRIIFLKKDIDITSSFLVAMPSKFKKKGEKYV